MGSFEVVTAASRISVGRVHGVTKGLLGGTGACASRGPGVGAAGLFQCCRSRSLAASPQQVSGPKGIGLRGQTHAPHTPASQETSLQA